MKTATRAKTNIWMTNYKSERKLNSNHFDDSPNHNSVFSLGYEETLQKTET